MKNNLKPFKVPTKKEQKEIVDRGFTAKPPTTKE